MAAAWLDRVRVTPGEMQIKKESPTRVDLVNDSDRKLTFKVKTTRFDDVKPNVGIGTLQPHGGKHNFNVFFKQLAGARPFSEHDRITILLNELPPECTSAEQYWKGKEATSAPAERVVIKLKPPREKSAPSSPATTLTTDTEEESEEESDEESEEEESETEDE